MDREPVAIPVRFRAMTEGTKEHWADIAKADEVFESDISRRVLGLLLLLRDDRHAFAVDRLEHCLQAATRAHRDGRNEEYVVCALLHDIGASVAPRAHAEFAGSILRHHVSEQNLWMVTHHDVFQGYYYNHFFNGDRNQRDRYKGHKYFECAAEFCELYDQAAFDPDYTSMRLVEFAPMVRRVFGKRR